MNLFSQAAAWLQLLASRQRLSFWSCDGATESTKRALKRFPAAQTPIKPGWSQNHAAASILASALLELLLDSKTYVFACVRVHACACASTCSHMCMRACEKSGGWEEESKGPSFPEVPELLHVLPKQKQRGHMHMIAEYAQISKRGTQVEKGPFQHYSHAGEIWSRESSKVVVPHTDHP